MAENYPTTNTQAGGRRVPPGQKFDPLSVLSETQLELYRTLRKNIDETQPGYPENIKNWCTSNCLCRYLRACSWNLKNAEKMLRESIEWRISYKPDEIAREELTLEAESNKMYVPGTYDKFGRPLLVMRPVRDNTGSEHRIAKVKYLVWCMERTIANMDEESGVEKLVMLVDMTGMRVAMNHDMKITRECMHILQNHYPERLGVGIFVNPPWIFWGFWKVVSLVIDPVTKEKIKFIKDLKESSGKAELLKIIDADQLETELGGTYTFKYDHQQWLKGEDPGSRGPPKLTPEQSTTSSPSSSSNSAATMS